MKIFDILFVPMGYLIRFAYSVTNNYLLAIILFALVCEIILSPIQIKQQKTQIAQAKLQPKVRAITKKYDGRTDNVSMQKKQQEISELYQKENFNPLGGCLPLLIQLPVIICLYQVIINPLRYISGLSEEIINTLAERLTSAGVTLGSTFQQTQIDIINYFHANGTAGYEDLLGDATLPVFKMGPVDLSLTPQIGDFNWLWLVPLFVFISSYLSAILMRRFTYQSPESEEMQNSTSMKIMNITMPLMSTWISFSVPAAVGCYWVFRSFISVIERFVISKIWPIPQPSEEELKAAEREYSAKKKEKSSGREPSKTPVRSLHRIDFDDEPLPPPTPDPEPEEPEISAEETPISKAPLKDDGKKKKK